MTSGDSIEVAGCGYRGRGDLSHEGDRGPCIAGYASAVVGRPEGGGLLTEDRLCPECEGEWLDRQPAEGSRFITPPELKAEKSGK